MSFQVPSSGGGVPFNVNGGTVKNEGPVTVYYRDEFPVSATTNDGSLVSGASATLPGSQWLIAAGSTSTVTVTAGSSSAGTGSVAPAIISGGNLGATYTLAMSASQEQWLFGTLDANNALTVTLAAGRAKLFLDNTAGRTLTVNGTGVAIQAGSLVEVLLESDGTNLYVNVPIPGLPTSFRPAPWSPADNGWMGASFSDTSLGSGGTGPAVGTYGTATVKVLTPGTIGNVVLQISTIGVTLSNCFVGIYNSAGTRIGLSGDQSSSWQSTGVKTIAITPTSAGTLDVVAGDTVIIALLVGNGSGTSPQIIRQNANQTWMNAGLSSPLYRSAVSAAGSLTALPNPIGTLNATPALLNHVAIAA